MPIPGGSFCACGRVVSECDGSRSRCVQPRCQCGQITGEPCAEVLGPDSQLVEHMPEHLRASHEAAGTWPYNGAVQLRLAPGCAAGLGDEWTQQICPEPTCWACGEASPEDGAGSCEVCSNTVDALS
jgi:hypothetical protein